MATEMTDSSVPIISCMTGERVDTGEVDEDNNPIYRVSHTLFI